MNNKSISIPVVSWAVFHKMVVEQFKFDHKDYSPDNMAEKFLDSGFPKLDQKNLKDFFKEAFIFMPTVLVESGDPTLLWMVSGLDAMLIHTGRIVTNPLAYTA